MQKVFEYLQDLIGKASTFIASRRIWFFGMVVLLLSLGGYFGLSDNTAKLLVAALTDTTNATLAWLTASLVLVKTIAGLVAVVVLAYKEIESQTVRPAHNKDYQTPESLPETFIPTTSTISVSGPAVG